MKRRRNRIRHRISLPLLCLAMILNGLAITPQVAVADSGLPTSMVDEGVYYVYATREGLVGGWTSSGHQIVPNDFFVSLPACTPQNCPRGATRGQMTNCGSFCYVKVVNPSNNRCRVEPIKDIGPWFTVDDWWNPTETRYVNNLSSNPQDLPQGYTASDAARDGLDVGYGRSQAGIGHDDTFQMPNRVLRQVGNRAAIDLADGTWYNLGMTAPDRIGNRVFVHMLWQTGESPVDAAARCGHPLNQRGNTGTTLPTVPPTTPYTYPETPASKPSPTPSPTMTPVTGSTAVVVGTGGAGLRCRTGPSTGASVIMTMAEGIRVDVRGVAISGWVPIRCNNQDGWASGSYLQVTWVTPTPTAPPTMTPTPTALPTESPTATAPPTETVTPTSTSVPPTVVPSLEPSPTPTLTPSPTVAPSPTIVPTPVPSSGSAVVSGTGGAGLRCRTGPSTGASIIGNLPEGTRVAIRGLTVSGWVPVTCSGRDGWVSGSYLRIEQPYPTATATATSVATPTPAPSPPPTATSTPPGTPSPTTATARVTGTGGVGLRCRTGPSTGAAVIMTLAEGSTVNVLGATSAGWVPVRCGSRDGWASATYLRITQSTPVPTVTPGQTGVIANSDGDRVNCRSAGSLSASVIASLAEGTMVTLRGPAAGDWQPVRCANRDGFIWAEYVSTSASTARAMTVAEAEDGTEPTGTSTTAGETPVATDVPSIETNVTPIATAITPTVTEDAPDPPPASMDTPVTGYGYIASESGAPINCRATPSTEGAIVTVVGHGSEIALRGDPVDGWQGVVCNGSYGYVAAQFISDTAPPPPPEPAPEESAPIPEEDIDPTAPPAEAYPEGSNPWFEGNPLPVSDTWSENGGSSAWNAVDGNDGTSWVSSSGAGQATITIDLGSEYQLTGVRWRLSEPGHADSLTIQASVDGASWVTFGTYGNRAAHTWEGVAAGMTARYVRFVADNPNGDPALGEIAEIQVWGVDATQSAPPLTRAHILPPIAATRRTRQPGPRSRWGISASQTRR